MDFAYLAAVALLVGLTFGLIAGCDRLLTRGKEPR
jgi:hypothetical protein